MRRKQDETEADQQECDEDHVEVWFRRERMRRRMLALALFNR